MNPARTRFTSIATGNAALFLSVLLLLPCASAHARRQTISLDGTWQIAEGAIDAIPAEFARTVVVPGLVDMAQPPFVEPGPKVMGERSQVPQKDPRRDAFWYRRSFTVDGPIPQRATLKIAKAMFGTRVFLNGKLLGDHAPSFTPGYFDAKAALKTGANELVVRVGADRDAVGREHVDGFDFEKRRYTPGIFDSVQLILTGSPRIDAVQVAPEIAARRARVRVYLDGPLPGDVTIEIREAKSGKTAGQATAPITAAAKELDIVVPIADCRLWSPEEPFLYELTVRTAGDEYKTRFGMREFRFDPATRRAVLNGRPYMLRGSNITLYRFFEDGERGSLPWDAAWVRKLHQRVKDMHWNCLRYCIGFPPEAWYEIADEEGILIQDEFPIWFGGPGWSTWPAALTRRELAAEYAEWMRERWNHPSVAIWDASNETTSAEIGPAIRQVRAMDLSGRPWDNSYTSPQEPGDVFESHPYHFQNAAFKLRNIAKSSPVPQGSAIPNDRKHAVIINEYGWLWLNRDGTPTTLTAKLYANLLGPNSTTAQRRRLYAQYTAAETEFWRCGREAAAVMHFTTLGYDRPDGQTSDHWTQGGVANLQWEPEFYKYVRDAFAPVGLMIDFWSDTPPSGTTTRVPVRLVNDLDAPWIGPVTLRLKSGDRVLVETKRDARIDPLGTAAVEFELAWPAEAAAYVLEAELRGADGQPVRSVRELAPRAARPASLAAHARVTASSVVRPDCVAENAVDGDEETFWSSKFQDDAWLAVDLGASKKISRVMILWEAAYARSFSVEVSADGRTWTTVYRTDAGQGGESQIKFAPVEARHVRIVCTRRGTKWGNGIRELEVLP